MTVATPVRPTSAREAIRVALAGLALAYEQHDPVGVSGAEMARACGVSAQAFSRYLSGERPFPLDHLPQLPSRAYRVALAAIEGCRAAPTTARTPDSRLRRLSIALGETNVLLDRFLADDVLDAGEKVRLAVSLSHLAGEALEGAADLTRGGAK